MNKALIGGVQLGQIHNQLINDLPLKWFKSNWDPYFTKYYVINRKRENEIPIEYSDTNWRDIHHPVGRMLNIRVRLVIIHISLLLIDGILPRIVLIHISMISNLLLLYNRPTMRVFNHINNVYMSTLRKSDYEGMSRIHNLLLHAKERKKHIISPFFKNLSNGWSLRFTK